MYRHYERNGITTRISRFVCETEFDDIPDQIVAYAKILIADTLACGFGASVLAGARNFATVAEAMGGAEQAVIVTTGKKVSSAAATFANAYLMYALDADDTFHTNGHPMASIFASALAVAEEVGATGQELILAVAIGYDVAIRCKRAIHKTRQGSMAWFVMGGVAAAAILYRLTEEQVAMAFGLAAFSSPHTASRWSSMASGRRHDMKYWANHATAFSAVTAAQLARAGFTCDRTIFDGDQTYANFIGSDGIDEDLMFEDIGRRWWIGETSIKPWASCKYAHISITLLNEIMLENHLNPEDIDAVEIQTWDFIASPWFSGKFEITNEYDAQFSFPHAVAAAILGWDMGPDWQAKAIGNQELNEVSWKASVTPYPKYQEECIVTPEGNRYMPTFISVRSGDRTFSKNGGVALGDPFEEQYKFTMDDIRKKFFRYAHFSLSDERAEEIFLNVQNLENIENVTFQLTV